MVSDFTGLPKKVASEINGILADLLQSGWQVLDYRFDPQSFGNWYVQLTRNDSSITVIKDRSQYTLNGPSKNELKGTGLERTFNDQADFRRALRHWDLGSGQ